MQALGSTRNNKFSISENVPSVWELVLRKLKFGLWSFNSCHLKYICCQDIIICFLRETQWCFDFWSYNFMIFLALLIALLVKSSSDLQRCHHFSSCWHLLSAHIHWDCHNLKRKVISTSDVKAAGKRKKKRRNTFVAVTPKNIWRDCSGFTGIWILPGSSFAGSTQKWDWSGRLSSFPPCFPSLPSSEQQHRETWGRGGQWNKDREPYQYFSQPEYQCFSCPVFQILS